MKKLAPQPGGNGFSAPFFNALENKQSSEITMRLNNYKKIKKIPKSP
jgi:hypothetical protein